MTPIMAWTPLSRANCTWAPWLSRGATDMVNIPRCSKYPPQLATCKAQKLQSFIIYIYVQRYIPYASMWTGTCMCMRMRLCASVYVKLRNYKALPYTYMCKDVCRMWPCGRARVCVCVCVYVHLCMCMRMHLHASVYVYVYVYGYGYGYGYGYAEYVQETNPAARVKSCSDSSIFHSWNKFLHLVQVIIHTVGKRCTSTRKNEFVTFLLHPSLICLCSVNPIMWHISARTTVLNRKSFKF